MSKTDRESDAERLYQDALRIMGASLLPNDPRIAVTLSISAELLYRAGQKEAEPLCSVL